ncbi:MAG: 4Fe-4S binding protein [Clostridium sp.]
MIRKIIKIDEDKCTGCTLCVDACHEGAIGMVNGKAKLLRDDYCDGLGDCLPACPVDAITFEHREALEYDEEAVQANIAKAKKSPLPVFSCPSSISKAQDNTSAPLKNWPVQIKLAAVNAPFFNDASLLIAADCCSFAYENFTKEFVKGRVTLIGCPKLDMEDYSKKLGEIIKSNNIKDITIAKMEVPCCMGLEIATLNALSSSQKDIPLNKVTISTKGDLI